MNFRSLATITFVVLFVGRVALGSPNLNTPTSDKEHWTQLHKKNSKVPAGEFKDTVVYLEAGAKGVPVDIFNLDPTTGRNGKQGVKMTVNYQSGGETVATVTVAVTKGNKRANVVITAHKKGEVVYVVEGQDTRRGNHVRLRLRIVVVKPKPKKKASKPAKRVGKPRSRKRGG